MSQTDHTATAKPSAKRSLDVETLKWAAGLVLLVAVFYWPALNNGFVWDDSEYVENNAQLRTAEGLYNIWFELGAIPQYYPLVHTMFWVEYHLWELAPAGYHVVNVLLHAACAILVWRLLARLAVPGAWLAAAIFAVHPVEVETVAWVSELKNVLSCALALGSLLAYLRFAPPETDEAAGPTAGRGEWGYYVLALVLYLGALLSKTVTISVPAVLLVIYWWKRGRIGWRDAAPLVPFLVVGLPLALVTVWMEKTHVGAAGADWNLSWVDRFLVAGRALWFYAGKLLWPYPLIFLYYRWTIDSGVWWQYLYPLAAVAVPVVLWFARGKIGRGPLAAVLIFGGVLLPALGFFDVYPFRFSFVADHFQYHASIALIALVTAAATTAFARFAARDSSLRELAAGGVILALGAVTYQRTHAYRNLMTLSQDTLAKNPGSWSARYNLGDALVSQGKFDEGIDEMREAVRMSPQQVWLRAGLATALAGAGKPDEAEALFREVLADQRYERAHGDTHVRLGTLLVAQDRADEAIEHFRQALKIDPNDHRAWTNYGLAVAKKGDPATAVEHLHKALELNAFDPAAHHALGVVLSEQGKIREALAHLETAVQFFPSNPRFREDLASAQIVAGDAEGAEENLKEAIRFDPASARAHNLLGMALAKRRNLGAAIREFEAALKLDPNLTDAQNNLQRARAARGR